KLPASRLLKTLDRSGSSHPVFRAFAAHIEKHLLILSTRYCGLTGTRWNCGADRIGSPPCSCLRLIRAVCRGTGVRIDKLHARAISRRRFWWEKRLALASLTNTEAHHETFQPTQGDPA